MNRYGSIKKTPMSKRKTGKVIEAIFKEIKDCDKLLAKYEDISDPLALATQEWKPISSGMMDQKRKIEEMKKKINEHLKLLVEWLNKLINNETIRCKSCKTVIPSHRLITIPDAELCLECKLKPLKISVYQNYQQKL